MEDITERCQSCGAETPLSTTGVTHAYLDASPGCWARFSEVLAREYSDPRCFAVHSLTVDAYAVQHPGSKRSQTINSVNLHLASLYAYYRNRIGLDKLSKLKSCLSKHKHQFQWLPPPAKLGELTINDIWRANTAEHHCESVIRWGEVALDCWSEYHSYIRNICDTCV